MEPGKPLLGATELAYVKKLSLLFGLFYFAQSLAQEEGILYQPINLYFMNALKWDTSDVEKFLWILTIPWGIKPLYGIITDYFPILGYRRKTWLLVTNLTACGGFLWLAGFSFDPNVILMALTLTAVGTAFADVIIDAIMVENGQKYNMAAKFQSIQWFWFFVGGIFTSIVGGYICKYLGADTSLEGAVNAIKVCSVLALILPVVVMVVSWMQVKEDNTRLGKDHLIETTAGIKEALKSPALWAAIFFLAFWSCCPSFGRTWYTHSTQVLGFKPDFMGWLEALGAGGAACGAWLYARYLSARTVKYQLNFSIVLGIAVILSHLLQVSPGPWTTYLAPGLHFMWGISECFAILSLLTLCTQVCPSKAEGFTFALLMSIYNWSEKGGRIIGAELYDHYLDKRILPLILISAGFTLLCLPFVPLLERFRKQS